MENERSLQATPLNAIQLKCHDCMGHYFDGFDDCKNKKCALYKFMPYAEEEPDLSTFRINPKKRGIVLLQPVNQEKADAARERFAKYREKKD